MPLLSKRQRDFAHAYAASGSGTQAAIAAGYAPSSAGTRAWELLRNSFVLGAVIAERERLGLPNQVRRTTRRVIRVHKVSTGRVRESLHWDDPANGVEPDAED